MSSDGQLSHRAPSPANAGRNINNGLDETGIMRSGIKLACL